MPYKNIVFVKLEKRLLNDARWFGMSDKAQLLYIKLMLGCAETYNKLPTKGTLLRQQLHIKWKQNVFDLALKEITEAYPKFKKNENFYYFEDFHEKTNYIRDCPSVAQVLPKQVADKEKDIDIYKEKEEDIDDRIKFLFVKRWSRNYKNLSEMQGAEQLVKEYGYEDTDKAFRIAGENDKTSIGYVRGILRKEKINTEPKSKFGNSKIMNELYGGESGH